MPSSLTAMISGEVSVAGSVPSGRFSMTGKLAIRSKLWACALNAVEDRSIAEKSVIVVVRIEPVPAGCASVLAGGLGALSDHFVTNE